MERVSVQWMFSNLQHVVHVVKQQIVASPHHIITTHRTTPSDRLPNWWSSNLSCRSLRSTPSSNIFTTTHPLERNEFEGKQHYPVHIFTDRISAQEILCQNAISKDNFYLVEEIKILQIVWLISNSSFIIISKIPHLTDSRSKIKQEQTNSLVRLVSLPTVSTSQGTSNFY
jgi:hypothetical protein